MIKGNVDLLSCNKADGWVCDTDDYNKKIYVEIVYNGILLKKELANKKRCDLDKIHKNGDFAFFINFDSVENVNNISVYAVIDSKTKILIPQNGKIINKNIGYQTFKDQNGDSNSFEKLKKLRLQPRYDGLSILDIGCNEGFFCIDALKRGADRVVGIDSNYQIIEKAKKRNNKIEYINNSWWEIPNEKFDIIYFLSAIHYEKKQKELLDKIYNHLTDNGKLILECGVHFGEKIWMSFQRHDGYIKFPSIKLLVENLLDKYCVTAMGKSIKQSGDPVERYVFHCKKKKTTIIFIYGKSSIGKTYISRKLASSSIASISIDTIFHYIKDSHEFISDNRYIYKKIRDDLDINKIDNFCDNLSEKELHLISELIFEALPLDMDCIIEGYTIGIPKIRNYLEKKFLELGLHVWDMSKNI